MSSQTRTSATNTVDFEDERITLFSLLIEVHDKLVRSLGADLEATCNLPMVWYEVLARTARYPGGRPIMSELADAVSLSTGGFTRLVDRIEAAGLVARQASSTDRRITHIVLTPAGEQLLAQATAQHVEGIDRDVASKLSGSEVLQLRKVLEKLRDSTRD